MYAYCYKPGNKAHATAYLCDHIVTSLSCTDNNNDVDFLLLMFSSNSSSSFLFSKEINTQSGHKNRI